MEKMLGKKLTFAFDASNDKNAYDANKLQGNFYLYFLLYGFIIFFKVIFWHPWDFFSFHDDTPIRQKHFPKLFLERNKIKGHKDTSSI